MDPLQPQEFREHPAWRELDETLSIFQIDPDTEQVQGFSFSGSERNRLFMNGDGRFTDATLYSGIDFTEDGRGFAFGDFDRDGYLDLGIVSNQSPRFRIAKLQQGSQPSSDGKLQRWVKVRLVGGNDTTAPNPNLSPREPVGAVLVAKTATSTRTFQLSCGEGFSVQNSQTIHIGLGENSKIEELKIRWPSGKITVEKDIMAGSNAKFFEIEN